MTEVAAAPPAGPAAVRFPCFDGYRALAALGVLVVHAAFISGLTLRNDALGPYLARLDVGVAVFFLISGFLLYRPFVAARLAGVAAARWRDYLRARALRIFPAYWVALTAVVYVFQQPGPRHEIDDVGDFVSYYFLLQQYTDAHAFGGIQQAWTLSVEIAFYLFLPLWAWAMGRLARRFGGVRADVAGLVVLYAVGLAWRAYVRGQGWSKMLFWLPAFFDQFALGMGLAVASAWAVHTGAVPRALALAGRHPGWCWALAGVSFWTVSTRLDLPRDFAELSVAQWIGWTVLYGLTALFLLLPGVFGPQDRGLVRGLLRHRALAGLGVVSYGLYLWHELWLDMYFEWFDVPFLDARFVLVVGFAFACSLVSAVLSWFLVEKPALRLKRGGRGPSAPAPRARPAGAPPVPAG